MIKIILKLCLLLCFISPCWMASNGHKYDVEVEALKLYGEDFKTVLKRFRKTPDYLRILNDKMGDVKVHVREMGLQILHFHHGKMAERVDEILGLNNKTEETETTPARLKYFHAFHHSGRRQDEEEEGKPEDPSDVTHETVTPDATGNGNGDEPQDERTPEQILDDYKVFHSVLSVSERNSFKELGFETAGNIIHSLVKNMGTVPDDKESKSTKLIVDDDTSTTEHPEVHEVTTEAEPEAKSPEEEEEKKPDDTRLRYKPKPKKNN